MIVSQPSKLSATEEYVLNLDPNTVSGKRIKDISYNSNANPFVSWMIRPLNWKGAMYRRVCSQACHDQVCEREKTFIQRSDATPWIMKFKNTERSFDLPLYLICTVSCLHFILYLGVVMILECSIIPGLASFLLYWSSTVQHIMFSQGSRYLL